MAGRYVVFCNAGAGLVCVLECAPLCCGPPALYILILAGSAPRVRQTVIVVTLSTLQVGTKQDRTTNFAMQHFGDILQLVN